VTRPDLGQAHAAALRRAEFLDRPDRMLAQMMLAQNATHRQIAGVLGIDPGTVCRRICKIANRLYDPLVIRLIDRPGGLRAEYRTLGIEYFLIGRSIVELADTHQMPRSRVRAILGMLRVWGRG
jgi:hypothetical protein